MLHRNIFDNICKKLKFYPEIDCFANRLNHQIPKYISYKPDPDAFLVDAFLLIGHYINVVFSHHLAWWEVCCKK